MKRAGKIWTPVEANSPYLAVLRRPNHYQNRIKFIEQWIVSKLLHGAAFALKQRDPRGIVEKLYLLDPQRVSILVAKSGDVFFRLSRDDLSGIGSQPITVPASEIIHDMMVSLWHPLVGVSPIYACGASGTLGNKIQANSQKFFANASRPSGLLSGPGEIADSTAARLKALWEENFSGDNIGRLAVLGDGLKYEAMTIPAVDAQLVEQLKWTVDDVARAFHYPLYKLGAQAPTYNNVEALTQTYYTDCLQTLIESWELSMDEGLALPDDLGVELDLRNLLRMDSATRYERHNKAVAGGWLAPNEAREEENLAPVDGGDSPMMQQQNWTLAQLADRPAPADAASVAPPARTPPADGAATEEEVEEEDGEQIEELTVIGFNKGLTTGAGYAQI
jgi:HK97 family phage portal protein